MFFLVFIQHKILYYIGSQQRFEEDFTFFLSNTEVQAAGAGQVNIGICQLKPEYYNSDKYRQEVVDALTDPTELPCMNDRMTEYTTQVYLSGCWFVKSAEIPWSGQGCEV